jgi:hypothetical protein
MRRFRRGRHTAPGAETARPAEHGAGEATREAALKRNKKRPLGLSRGGASSFVVLSADGGIDNHRREDATMI